MPNQPPRELSFISSSKASGKDPLKSFRLFSHDVLVR